MNQTKKILIIFCTLLSWIEVIYGSLTTSLIVPCHYKHFKHLNELLQVYEKQTSLPNEVVISISETNQIDQEAINSLQNTQWLFPVKLLLSNKKLFAGQNRNIACSHATSEIFVCQDADDLPHPQRIEIIKYFFDKFKLDFLLHKFVYNNENEIKQLKTIEDMTTIEHSFIKTYHEAWIVGYMLFGQPAINRKVFQRIKWPESPIGEDNAFDNRVILTFKKCMMIKCPLYIYRFENSVTPYHLYKNHFQIKRNLSNHKLYKVEVFYI